MKIYKNKKIIFFNKNWDKKLKSKKTGQNRTNPEILPRLTLAHYDSFWTTFSKNKRKKYKFFKKNKNKKFIFFIGQEIKKPDLSGQVR